MSDLISRQAAIDECYPVTVDGEVYEVVQVETLMGLPSVEPKTGHWLRYDIDGEPNEVDTFHWQCDQCLCTEHGRRSIPWRFCPNCGARMGR